MFRSIPKTKALTRRCIVKGAFATTLLTQLVIPPAAYADRERLSFSEVSYNQGSELLEVTHRLHLHDAQQALTGEGLLSTPDLTPLRARAALALYVANQFKINRGETLLLLETLGAQIEGNYIYIYQQAAMKTEPQQLTIHCEILQSIFSDQANHVNVKLKQSLTTLTFVKGEREKKAPAL